jgi:glycosyltransferase involved in cell wall biosynthesis
VTAALGAGGAEKVLALLTRHSVDCGNQVTIVTFDAPDDPVYHPLPASVRLVRLALPATGVGATARRILALRRVVRQERAHVVLSFLTKINVLTLVATAGLKVPVIVAERNNPNKQRAHPAWSLMLWAAYLRASAIICQTAASVRCIPAHSRSRVTVIPNPVTPSRFKPPSGAPRRVVAVGRLSEQKGFDLLIDAFRKIAGRQPDWHLEIWGEGPDRAKLEKQVRRLDLQDRISLPGLSNKPGEWVERASAFVLSSRYEGFANVLGEAMAAGLPAISFDCDYGPADMISSGRDGLLVPPGDVDALADCMERIMHDEALRRRLGENAKFIVEQFSSDRIIGLWDKCIGRVAQRPVRRGMPYPALRGKSKRKRWSDPSNRFEVTSHLE